MINWIKNLFRKTKLEHIGTTNIVYTLGNVDLGTEKSVPVFKEVFIDNCEVKSVYALSNDNTKHYYNLKIYVDTGKFVVK